MYNTDVSVKLFVNRVTSRSKELHNFEDNRIGVRGFIEICYTGCTLLISFSTPKRTDSCERAEIRFLAFTFAFCKLQVIFIKITIDIKRIERKGEKLKRDIPSNGRTYY